MEDDFTFGSVWATDNATPSAFVVSPPPAAFPSLIPAEDDPFDDFGEPSLEPVASADDDDFGDFGDFGEGDDGGGFADDAGFEDQAHMAGPSSSGAWGPLRLDPPPPFEELEEQIEDILGPLWMHDDPSQAFTDDDIREVGGLNQLLITPESRILYQTLFASSPPPAHPPNWTRTRIRRQHLITLGIPVNLDEVLPHANGKPLPALQITTRPMSAPPGARSAHVNGGTSSLHGSRAGSSASAARTRGGAAAQLSLGPKPQLDEMKISGLLAPTHDQLSLLPLPVLNRHLAELRTETGNTSALLTHLLQTKDALQQDSDMYNKLIAELVGEAQKMKSGKLGRAPSRRGSGMV
ncbi:hypothetical protein OF83DRAFT_1171561 [Amylostereum chailletii]|nr:hypothetical protein OF83DRAFT_1171561 [Amylostereum chailletii]